MFLTSFYGNSATEGETAKVDVLGNWIGKFRILPEKSLLPSVEALNENILGFLSSFQGRDIYILSSTVKNVPIPISRSKVLRKVQHRHYFLAPTPSIFLFRTIFSAIFRSKGKRSCVIESLRLRHRSMRNIVKSGLIHRRRMGKSPFFGVLFRISFPFSHPLPPLNARNL